VASGPVEIGSKVAKSNKKCEKEVAKSDKK
jgi:hypothetical protein